MATREVRVELLLGRPVVDSDGAKVGRIEDIVAEYRDGELLVTEYHTGGFAMLERLAAAALGEWVLRALHRGGPGHAIAWDELDLSDWERPRTTRPKRELRRREH